VPNSDAGHWRSSQLIGVANVAVADHAGRLP
jgi:hypothetical protein